MVPNLPIRLIGNLSQHSVNSLYQAIEKFENEPFSKAINEEGITPLARYESVFGYAILVGRQKDCYTIYSDNGA